MRKGHIVLIPFPFTDLAGQKVRPALVLHVSRGEDCIVAFISAQPVKKRHSYDIQIIPTRRNGLKTESFIKVDKLATLQKKIVIGELGAVEQSVLCAVDSTLKKMFRV